MNIPVRLSKMRYVDRKSIHICFSLKKGRSDTALYPEYVIKLYIDI